MKANEAPEKIYMPNELLSEEWTRHIEGEDIEYTRTDAFMEKAAKYLQEHLIDYWSQGVTDESEFIESFEKAMKL